MKLLHIDSAATGDQSVTRGLTRAIVARWHEAVPGLTVTYRDLDARPLAYLTWDLLAKADPTAAEESERTLQDFLDHDVIVIGAPMYNFAVPSTLKAWINRIAVAGRTYRYTADGPEGLAGDKRVVIASGRGGLWDDLTDWVVVDQHRYERSQSTEVAAAVAHFNSRLTAEGRTYGLIGVGRWGSSQPWLGIPVKWEDISGARVIVEAGFRDFKVTPSQGTHSYQSLVSLGVAYFTVNADAGEGFVDWEWLAAAPQMAEEGPVRLVRLPAPATAVLNGRQRRGLLVKPEGM